jgi:hypothetical protein
MSPEEIYAMAEELNFVVEHDVDGTIILITQVVDEAKRSDADEPESFETFDEMMGDMYDYEEEDEIYDEEEETE